MKNNKIPIAKLNIRPNGSIKGSVVNASGKEIAAILSKGNGVFSQIERKKNNRGETIAVIHSAWGNDFYHEDIKFTKTCNGRKISKAYIENKLQEKRQLRLLCKNIVRKNKS